LKFGIRGRKLPVQVVRLGRKRKGKWPAADRLLPLPKEGARERLPMLSLPKKADRKDA
jgi:hypothetical protein